MARSHSQASKTHESSRVPAWVWLFTGAVLGAFIMFLTRLSEIQQDPSSPNSSSQSTSEKEVQKPRFDFYSLLKENKVPTTHEGPASTNNGESSSQQKAVQKQEFLLQVASFKSLEDADQLRAQLILLNLEAYTERAKIRNGETWHRVIVGPFVSKSKLAKARSTLLSNRHEALVLKRSPQG